jgi:hypothetical protein
VRTGFEDKEHSKIASAVGLPKSRINIIARDISLFSETNPRSTEQDLTRFPYSYAMFCCKFVFNRFWTNDLFNMNGRDPFITLMILWDYIPDRNNSEEKKALPPTAFSKHNSHLPFYGTHQLMFGGAGLIGAVYHLLVTMKVSDHLT